MADEISTRERKKGRMRLELVAAALDLFRERGYEATTIDDIAERAGCSRRTFFRYFGSKEDVGFGDALVRLADFHERLASAGPTHEPIDVVRAALHEQARAYYDEPVDRAAMDLWFNEPALSRRFIEISEQWELAVADFLVQAGGGQGAAQLAPQVIATAMCGVVKAVLRARLPGPSEVEVALASGFALVENGLHSSTRA